MITIIYSTHKSEEYNNSFKENLLKTVGVNNPQILEFQNNNEFSLAEIYNKGINQSIYDIIVCVHNDINLENGWGKKLLSIFKKNPQYGIIGKAGSCYFPKSGVYWEKINETMVGQVYHRPKEGKKFLSKYSAKLPVLIPVVTIDGLFISFDKNKVKHFFDESIGKFHFYDHGFCIPNYLDGVKIGVTSAFDITHDSFGIPNEEFYASKELFLNKYSNKLPLDLKPEEIYVPKINDIRLKINGKIAIIILTKGKIDMLIDCIESYIKLTKNVNYEFFIADTGSSIEEKKHFKDFINKNENIKINFIEYDYYNFAKINNDIVKNYINDNFEYLIFSNNDIKILNNVVLNMVKIFKTSSNIGTVGCRLHFADNTVQHDGIFSFIDNQKTLQVSHLGLNSYYNYSTSSKNVIGNTCALLMIKKNIFEKCGNFNENYISCFEDVELNMQCICLGLNNVCDSNSVAYHYESQTRNEDSNKITNSMTDYKNSLLPYVIKNFEKLKPFIVNLNK